MDEGAEGSGRRPIKGRAVGAIAIVVAVIVVGAVVRGPSTVDGGPVPTVVAGTPTAPPAAGPLPADPTATGEGALPVADGTWTDIELPPAFADRPPGALPAITRVGGDLVAVLGTTAAAMDLATGTWRDLPPRPGDAEPGGSLTIAARGDATLAVSSQRLPGSIEETFRLHRIEPGGTEWTSLPDLPSSQVVVLGGDADAELLVGEDADGVIRAWRLPVGADAWTQLPDLPRAVPLAQAFATSSGPVLIGLAESVDGGLPIDPVGFQLTPDATGWTGLAVPPERLTFNTAVAVDEAVLLLDARGSSGLRLSRYDVAADRWTDRDLPMTETAPQAVAGAAFIGSWDGVRVAWFLSFGEEGLVAVDLATDEVTAVPLPQGESLADAVVAVDDGVIVARYPFRPADGSEVPAPTLSRWIRSG